MSGWLYKFEPTVQGLVLCHRWHMGEPRGATRIALDAPVVRACFTGEELAELTLAQEMTDAASVRRP